MLLSLFAATMLDCAPASAQASTVVTTTNDNGPGSLCKAVLAVDANPGPDTISFDIPGPQIITLSTPLPPILGAVDKIDRTTQPGASCGDPWARTPPNLLINLNASALGAPSSMTFNGNRTGVAAAGVMPAGSRGYGINNTIVPGAIIVGGPVVGQGNNIARNGGAGVVADFAIGSNTAAIGNRIYANAQLGVDLCAAGLTLNDPGDGDSGPNDLLNFPEIAGINILGANQLGYNFALDAPATAPGYRIEFFASSAADPTGHGEGERYLGHADISHGGGVQSHTGTLTTLGPISIGDIISATTTRRTAGGSWDMTSEFSAIATPGQDILLTITVSNGGTGSTDADSLFVAIALDPANTFFNDVTPALGAASLSET